MGKKRCKKWVTSVGKRRVRRWKSWRSLVAPTSKRKVLPSGGSCCCKTVFVFVTAPDYEPFDYMNLTFFIHTSSLKIHEAAPKGVRSIETA